MSEQANTFTPAPSLLGTPHGMPHHAEEIAAAHHPYPGWQPSHRRDSSALAPYIDDDPFAPVSTTLNGLGTAHTVAEAAFEGSHAMHAVGGIAAPLELVSGTMDIIGGVHACQAGHCEQGAGDVTSGVAGIGAGTSGFAALAGIPGAALAGAGFAGYEGGFHIGNYGMEQVKERAWLHGADGHAESPSEWAADNGVAVEEWCAEHGHPTLGKVAGLGATYYSSLAGAGMALAGAEIGASEALLDDAPYRVMRAHMPDPNNPTFSEWFANYHRDLKKGDIQ